VIEATLVRDGVRQAGLLVASQPVLRLVPWRESALLAFTLPPLEAACVARAELRVPAVAVDRSIKAWVSVETDLPSLPDGASLGWSVIAKGSPAVTSHLDGGTLTWDVTGLVSWGHSPTEPATLFVVALMPDFLSIGDAPVLLGASEGGQPSVLRITVDPACPPI
jgi:hypothetical protein